MAAGLREAAGPTWIYQSLVVPPSEDYGHLPLQSPKRVLPILVREYRADQATSQMIPTGPPEDLRSFEVIDERKKMRCSDDVYVFTCPHRLPAAAGRAD